MLPISLVNDQELPDPKSSNQEDSSLGQILKVKNKAQSPTNDPDLGIEITLITDTLEKLNQLLEKQPGKCLLPTPGAVLADGFQKKFPICDPNQNTEQQLCNMARYNQVRMLLVARKMSQLVAKTWLDLKTLENEEKEKFSLIRKVILKGNQPPSLSSVEDSEGNNKYNLKEIASKLKLAQSSTIILPGRLNWQSINLNLLLAGQVYLEKDDGTLSLLSEPILSTYEAVNMYAFKLVFNDFVSYAEELQKPGLSSVPPYLLWTFPYPPRPKIDESTELTYEMIESWAYAPDEEQPDQNPNNCQSLPFYSPDYNKVKYVVPPYPYMPLSH
jgi:hypothetical protein